MNRLYKVTGNGQFDQILRRGVVIKGLHMVFFKYPKNRRFGRLGIVVSKRNIPKAVTRNKIKRIIRESFRTNEKYLEQSDVVVKIKKSADKALACELKKDLHKIWNA